MVVLHSFALDANPNGDAAVRISICIAALDHAVDGKGFNGELALLPRTSDFNII
jgi:hypothetical protein